MPNTGVVTIGSPIRHRLEDDPRIALDARRADEHVGSDEIPCDVRRFRARSSHARGAVRPATPRRGCSSVAVAARAIADDERAHTRRAAASGSSSSARARSCWPLRSHTVPRSSNATSPSARRRRAPRCRAVDAGGGGDEAPPVEAVVDHGEVVARVERRRTVRGGVGDEDRSGTDTHSTRARARRRRRDTGGSIPATARFRADSRSMAARADARRRSRRTSAACCRRRRSRRAFAIHAAKRSSAASYSRPVITPASGCGATWTAMPSALVRCAQRSVGGE